MSLQEILSQLKNIKDQSINDDEITKGSIVNALTDLIHDVEGNDGFAFGGDDDDHYASFEETDFSGLETI